MKKIVLLVCGLLTTYLILAQKHDYNYFVTSSVDTLNHGVHFQYSDVTQDISIDTFNIHGRISISPVFSDSEGDFLMYTNSFQIYDSLGRVAINGDSMFHGQFLELRNQWYPPDLGYGVGANAAFIEIHDSLFYLLQCAPERPSIGEWDFLPIEEQGYSLNAFSSGFWMTKIRKNKDGRMSILPHEKKIQILDDILGNQQLTLVKKENGKDWWVLLPELLTDSAHYYSLDILNENLEYQGRQHFSNMNGRVNGSPAICVHPDGEKIVRLLNQGVSDLSHKLEIFNFDRCTGLTERIFVDSFYPAELSSPAGDVEFSDNGRFLYIALSEYILQLDLEDPNPTQTWDTIGKWDGYRYHGNLPPTMDQLWKLPNGKIMSCGLVSTPYAHYIHNPNEKGDDCNFEQRALKMPPDPFTGELGFFLLLTSLPTYPPYRMPPLDYSCEVSNHEEAGQQSVFVSLYPNPSSDVVQVQIQGARIKYAVLYDMSGIARKSSSLGEFLVHDLEKGAYLVQIETDKGAFIQKLLVQ